jgi:hypothetical protein
VRSPCGNSADIEFGSERTSKDWFGLLYFSLTETVMQISGAAGSALVFYGRNADKLATCLAVQYRIHSPMFVVCISAYFFYIS